MGTIISHLNFDAPKVKWEAARVVGNLSPKFPVEVVATIPSLIKNTSDKGTVVRWSTAFALGEIVKNNSKIRLKVLPQMGSILKREKNNGVRNVYLRALKDIGKGGGNE